jgi:flagellar biosynthesis protein FlhB
VSEKPFEPTQSRLARAKREGDVARSQELGAVIAFAGALVAVPFAAPAVASSAVRALSAAASGDTDIFALLRIAASGACVAACAAFAALATHAMQAGGLSLTPVGFKAERLNPVENLRRMFSREAAVTAARATLAVSVAALALVPGIGSIVQSSLHAGAVADAANAAWSGALRMSVVACIVGGVFAGIDYGVQHLRWRKRLRMSFEEMKRDHKEQDGDPVARGRRRAMHRRLARGSLQRVKDAAFVVTNPTHLAIALEYRPPAVVVPRVLVRAADDAAARVREMACAYRIPIVENVPLARLLYERSKPGDFIPNETFVAVAEVVAALTRAGAMGE